MRLRMAALVLAAAAVLPPRRAGASTFKSESTTTAALRAITDQLATTTDPELAFELRKTLASFAITPQIYGTGFSRRMLQGSGGTRAGGSPQTEDKAHREYTTQDVATESFSPIRIVWRTEKLYPSLSNSKPDGNESCYEVGDWYRLGDPTGAPPTSAECPEGSCSLCGRDNEEDCWAECIEEDIATDAEFAHIKELLAQSEKILSTMLEVRPIVGALRMNPGIPCQGYQGIETVDSADIVIFITARPGRHGSFKSAQAYASLCQSDQHGRSISGLINFVVGKGSSGASKVATSGVPLVIHEAFHALGFSVNFWGPKNNRLLDEDLNPRGTLESQVHPYETYNSTEAKSQEEYSRIFVKPPRALIAARRFFGCPQLEQLEIEDEGGPGSRGSHWEMNHFLESYVAASIGGSADILEVTLAFFEDTGMYRANLSTAGWSSYGFQQGCDFLGTDCGTYGRQDSTVSHAYSVFTKDASYMPSYNVTTKVVTPPEIGTVCSFDRMGTTNNVFTLSQVTDICSGTDTSWNSACTHKPWHVHFADSDGGPEDGMFLDWESSNTFGNQCPIPEKSFPCAAVLDGQDWLYGKDNSSAARCFDANVIKKGYVPKMRPRCLAHTCQADKLQIHIGGVSDDSGNYVEKYTIDCPTEGGSVSAEGEWIGEVQCPPFDELCTFEASMAREQAKLQSDHLRVKGVIPVAGSVNGGAKVRITARGMNKHTTVYFGNVSTDSVIILEDDPQTAIVTVPQNTNSPDGKWPEGAVGITLKGKDDSGALEEDTAHGAFTFSKAALNSLELDAMTRPIGKSPVRGGYHELTTGPTWHMAYYHLKRDGPGFQDGPTDDIFYAVHLYYHAEKPSQNSDVNYTIHAKDEESRCVATDATASEPKKFDCSTLDETACEAATECKLTAQQSVVFSIELQAGGQSSYQLLVDVGKVPSRRLHSRIFPSTDTTMVFGDVQHFITDCQGHLDCELDGQSGCTNVDLDDCGVCGGGSYQGSNSTMMCDIAVKGCACESSWSVPSLCGDTTFQGCNNVDLTTGEPCHKLLGGMTTATWQQQGESWCQVSDDCPAGRYLGSLGGSKFAACVPPPQLDCGSNTIKTPTLGPANKALTVDSCGKCGGDGTGCGDFSKGGCQCLDSWTVPNFGGSEACNVGGKAGMPKKQFSGCGNINLANNEPCHGWYSNRVPADWAKDKESYCAVGPDCKDSIIGTFSGVSYAKCVPPEYLFEGKSYSRLVPEPEPEREPEQEPPQLSTQPVAEPALEPEVEPSFEPALEPAVQPGDNKTDAMGVTVWKKTDILNKTYFDELVLDTAYPFCDTTKLDDCAEVVLDGVDVAARTQQCTGAGDGTGTGVQACIYTPDDADTTGNEERCHVDSVTQCLAFFGKGSVSPDPDPEHFPDCGKDFAIDNCPDGGVLRYSVQESVITKNLTEWYITNEGDNETDVMQPGDNETDTMQPGDNETANYIPATEDGPKSDPVKCHVDRLFTTLAESKPFGTLYSELYPEFLGACYAMTVKWSEDHAGKTVSMVSSCTRGGRTSCDIAKLILEVKTATSNDAWHYSETYKSCVRVRSEMCSATNDVVRGLVFK